MCQHLLAAGADVNEKTNSSGSTALHRAAMMGKKFWFSLKKTITYLFLLSYPFAGNDKIVELLLHNKGVAELKDADGNTALHRAAQNGHLGVTKILVEHNEANRLWLNNKGQTPFDLIANITDNSLSDDLKSFLRIVE